MRWFLFEPYKEVDGIAVAFGVKWTGSHIANILMQAARQLPATRLAAATIKATKCCGCPSEYKCLVELAVYVCVTIPYKQFLLGYVPALLKSTGGSLSRRRVLAYKARPLPGESLDLAVLLGVFGRGSLVKLAAKSLWQLQEVLVSVE